MLGEFKKLINNFVRCCIKESEDKAETENCDYRSNMVQLSSERDSGSWIVSSFQWSRDDFMFIIINEIIIVVADL